MSAAPTAAAVPTDLIELGRITAAYGVKGWVKVQPHSAEAGVLRAASTWWLTRPAPDTAQGMSVLAPLAYQVLHARAQGATVVAQLAGVTDRDQADALRGYVVRAPRGAFPAPDEDEYYWVDLIGCAFYSTTQGDAQRIGVVSEVLDNGAHAILRVMREQTDQDGVCRPILNAKGKPLDILVPFVRAHIHAVDLAARRIDSDWSTDF